MTSRFFVYGALSEGMLHWSKISQFVVEKSPAWIQGSAWRLKVGFPVLSAEGEDLIQGLCVELQARDLLLGLLDEFHGFNQFDPEKSLFHRVTRSLLNERGESLGLESQVYVLNPKKRPATATLIAGGDWLANLKSQPTLVEQLTERQVTYLRKLGAASGRDIVPINDLSLYRELMNLDLIVDKGRRLALSKLGQEVVRYL